MIERCTERHRLTLLMREERGGPIEKEGKKKKFKNAREKATANYARHRRRRRRRASRLCTPEGMTEH